MMPWLRHLAILFVLVAALVRPAPASALAPAGQEARVGAFEVAIQLLTNDLGAASREQYQEISGMFKGGRTLRETIEGLKSHAISPESITPVQVFGRGGYTCTLHKRRMPVPEAGIPIRTVPATATEIAAEAWKLTTTNEGTSIIGRGGP